MASFVERLRNALRPDYELADELGRGGMGVVFQARDVALNRRVAIKIVRPEVATATAMERFVLEARVLAQLAHPNVVPVFRAGDAQGVPYYVMAFQEGDTLAQRIAGGPLSPRGALKVGRDILDALEAVHRVGIIHRDLKPSNIFFDGTRAMIADFGLARTTMSDETEVKGHPEGTPGYMPPEQAFGWELTPQTDLYAAGMVVYEAFTGRRWTARLPDEKPDWSGVPASVVPILRRALAWDPKDRWPDAATFRRRLWATRTRWYRLRTAALTVAGLTVGAAVAALVINGDDVEPADIAILPFSAGPGLESLAADLTTFTRMHLDPVARLSYVDVVAAWWDTLGRRTDAITERAVRHLGTRYAAHATVEAVNGDTLVRITLVDDEGRAIDGGTHDVSDRPLAQKGHLVGYHLARWIKADVDPEYGSLPGVSDPAVAAFLAGYRAFERNLFRTARDQFGLALELDPDFAWAAWWYSNAWRWGVSGQPAVIDHAALLERGTLPDLDRRLLAAQLTPDLSRRLAAYEAVLRDYPDHAYATFLYSSESQDRGPYVGVSLETVVGRLEAAARADTTFGPALGNLVWAYIRDGRRDAAVQTLERYARISGPPNEMFVNQPVLLEFAIAERFFPERSEAARAQLLQDSAMAAELAGVFRIAAMFGLHHTQRALATMLRPHVQPNAAAVAGTHVAEGLALWALGDLDGALAAHDAAATLFGGPEARLQAAGWALLPGIVRLPPPATNRVDAARGRMRQLVNTRETAAGAAWMLGHDALARGAVPEAREWRRVLASLPADSVTERLGRLLDADQAGATGDYTRAEQLSRPLLAHDSAGNGGDPFARAVLHLRRATWLEQLGRHAAADSARRWYQHFEFTGLPSGLAQPEEIDWALGPWVELVRGRAAVAHDDYAAACRHFARVQDAWRDAVGSVGPFRAEAAEWSARRCRT